MPTSEYFQSDIGHQTRKHYFHAISTNLLQIVLSSLKESVQGFYESAGCKPIMADLTGGEDTRLLVAQCHALGIPFKAHVTGSNDNSDVIVAKQAAAKTGIDLIVRKQEWISEEDILAHARNIVLKAMLIREFIAVLR